MRAYVTLLTQPNYLPGVRVLRASLARTGSPYPLAVMVTEAIDADARRLLAEEGCLVRPVDPVQPDGGLTGHYANARFAEVWTKLAAWQLTEFERIVFLDADMLVVATMDELFELELADDQIAACHACRCNPNRIASYPADWTPANCHYSYGDGGSTTAAELAPAGLDRYLNGGFLVLRPDLGVYRQLGAELAAVDDLARYPFAEQDFLNEHYAGRWVDVSYVYNALKTLPTQHPQLWQADAVKNVHYIIDKPWQAEPDPEGRYFELETMWWQLADEVFDDSDRPVALSG